MQIMIMTRRTRRVLSTKNAIFLGTCGRIIYAIYYFSNRRETLNESICKRRTRMVTAMLLNAQKNVETLEEIL
jgi:hypothetical protein